MLGTGIGSYIVEAKLGEGGMGDVYLGRHRTLGTPAAIKVMSPAFSHKPQLRERFEREARAQALLRHPKIVQVFDYLEIGNLWFLIVEYMDGGSLDELFASSQVSIPTSKALDWVRQILSGLDFAHSKGIIHRDVKPSNILFNNRGEVAVADFGISLHVGDKRLTPTGISIGTPEYMSPEQIRGVVDLDHRADVYSTGVVLYELLGGRTPFENASTFEVQRAQVCDPPPALSLLKPELPPELESVVMKSLAKDRKDRYATCGRFAEAITAFEHGESLKQYLFAFNSCFISYSHADQGFARRLYSSLQARGILCWLDEHELKPGDRILNVINDAIRVHDKILLCCSETSLKSWWVNDEIRKAQERERRDGRDIIIPLMLDGYLLNEWENGLAADLRSRLAADFRGWENDSAMFECEFERVIEALRTSGSVEEREE